MNAKQPINLLRKHLAGHWFYDYRAHAWKHESGLTVQRFIGLDSDVLVYKRMDTGAVIDLHSGRGLAEAGPCPFGHRKGCRFEHTGSGAGADCLEIAKMAIRTYDGNTLTDPSAPPTPTPDRSAN